jgi:hypothetical protein
MLRFIGYLQRCTSIFLIIVYDIHVFLLLLLLQTFDLRMLSPVLQLAELQTVLSL